jgi:uncharacterized protein (TIGR00730 family)
MKPGRPKQVVIFGGSSYNPGEEAYEAAEALGRAIAENGWTIVNGGYGGTMLACSRGAAGVGGEVIGVGCTILKTGLNEHVTQPVLTANLHDRLARLIELGDAYVALPGSTGTLAELAMVWELVNKQLIPVRPILCWGDFWKPVVCVFSQDGTQDPRINTLGVTESRGDLIHFVTTPDEAVRVITELT